QRRARAIELSTRERLKTIARSGGVGRERRRRIEIGEQPRPLGEQRAERLGIAAPGGGHRGDVLRLAEQLLEARLGDGERGAALGARGGRSDAAREVVRALTAFAPGIDTIV